MLCLECGSEMSLVQVVEDTTMLVSGYEHHTWQCSACSTVEQRMTFTREKTPIPTAVEPTQTVPVEPTQAVPLEPTHPNRPVAMIQTNARLEKLRSLQERATTAKETASEVERRAEFNRFWDSLLSVPSPSTSSEALNHLKPDEPMRSGTGPNVSLEPSALESKA